MPKEPRVCYVVSHTHWDREWYLPYHRFRVMLADTVGLVFAMSQGNAWQSLLEETWRAKVRFVFQSPHFNLTPRGWTIDSASLS